MQQKVILRLLLCFFVAGIALESVASEHPPNLLIILADDLGYGDVGCYNPEAKVPTPHLERLATEGLRFTDAHSPATVCTPTRYSLLTGRMAFRTNRSRVFSGAGGPCLIEPQRLTLGGMLQQHGYSTALFGKWHVRLTFYDHDGQPLHKGGLGPVKRIDYSRPIPDGPIDRGFDKFFGTACCPTTDWLYAYIEGDRIPEPPIRQHDRNVLPQNPYTGDCRDGMIAPNFALEEVDLVFLKRSQKFLREHAESQPDRPFFLLHSMQAVHLPSLPAKKFQDATDAGPHGDFIHQLDWTVGQLMKTLDDLKLADNTLVMFMSDNGPEVPTTIAMRRDHNHDGARPWRGVKRDAWEGGHRTPLIMRWPNKIKPGTTSDEITSLTDVMATMAEIVEHRLPNDAAEDSYSMLPVLLSQARDQPIRPYLLQQTWTSKLSIRRGDWKYLDHQGSGGNNYDKPSPWGMSDYKLPELDPSAPGQLYNLADDPGETANLYSKHPNLVAKLKALLKQTMQTGRSAPSR